ncbi:MAG: DUF4199 domain-containing protein [Bacteroidia bacterium]|nr:DUF4199 domain-containing protein [Bacteroidia bacterium]
MSKYYLIFGGIAGISSAILEYLLFSGKLGFDKMGGVLFGKVLGLIICIVFAVILIKKLNNGISFMRTSFSGLMIALICSAVSGIGYSYMYYPDGAFFNDAKEYTFEYWKEANKDDPKELARAEEQREDIERTYSLRYHTILDLGTFMTIGLVFTAFLAGIVGDRRSLAG